MDFPTLGALLVSQALQGLLIPTCSLHISQDKAGIIPALQLLSYAGKHLNDSQRTLAQ